MALDYIVNIPQDHRRALLDFLRRIERGRFSALCRLKNRRGQKRGLDLVAADVRKADGI